MVLKRIVALGIVLPATTACSLLPTGRGVYSALPPVAATSPAIPVDDTAAAVSDLDIDLPPAPIPGAPTTLESAAGRGGVNPSAVLEASMRARTGWKVLRPTDIPERSALAARLDNPAGPDVARTAAIPAAKGPPLGANASTTVMALEDGRSAAAMSRLARNGREAEKTICSGC